MKKFSITKYLFAFFSSFLLSIFPGNSTHLDENDSSVIYVPNRVVRGTNDTIFTGLYYKVQSKFGRYLDMRHESSGDAHPALSLTEDYMNKCTHALDSFQVRLIDQGNGYYKVQSKFGRYLDMRHESSGDAHPVLSLTEGYMNKCMYALDSFQVRFIPHSYKIEASIEDFQYSNLLHNISANMVDIDLISSMVFRNNSNVTLEETISETREKKNTYSWSFQEDTSLHFSDKFTVTAKASGSFLGIITASAQATNVFEWEWQRNTHTRTEKVIEETKSYQIKKKITVPPHTHIRAQSLVKWVNNATVPFTATLKLTGYADRAKHDGSVAHYARVSSQVLEHFLQNEGYNYEGMIMRNDALYAQVSGNLTVNAGFDTIFRTEPLN